jgi:hypothetical protein
MGNVWLADVGADPRQRAREIGRAHVAFLTGHAITPVDQGLRDVVAQSWLRSSGAHLAPDGHPPVALTGAELDAYRSAHPLSSVIGVLRQLVGTVADDGGELMAVSDADGRLLWVEGDRHARTLAGRMNFVEGALWDEAHAGTNAPGTALALDHEVQIFATEHFLPHVQAWTCAAAPIHDPASGEILGVIDITGGDGVANPLSLALVRAAARAAEAELARGVGGPLLWVPAHRQANRLSALGRGDGLLSLSGRHLRLHRRHAEIMIMLAAYPEGLTGEQLAATLYDDLANPTTLRVEMTRLRRVIGGALGSRPYRLTSVFATDFGEVAAALRGGDVAAAVAGYPGPLLPSSEAPGVVSQREWLDTRLRSAVLACSDPELVHTWADRCGRDDLAVWERLHRIAPQMSAHRLVAAERARRLRAEYGLR